MARQGGCAGGHRGMSLSRARIKLSFIVTVPIAQKVGPGPPCPGPTRYAFSPVLVRANLTANRSGSRWQEKGN